jgi:SAM-dependent methyltransferase
MGAADDGYGADLAYIHDVGFGDFARRAATGLLEILHCGGITDGRVVDLGCGSGIWARELLDAGYKVIGVDLSAPMIELARQKAPEARFEAASYLDVEIPPCVAVTAIGECFNYQTDARAHGAELGRLFRRVHRALRPGGHFLFDVAEPGRGRASTGGCFEGDDWAVLVRVEEDTRRGELRRRMTTFRRVGELYRRGEVTHVLRLYWGSELARELRGIGFRVRILCGYGAFRLPLGHVAILARKP